MNFMWFNDPNQTNRSLKNTFRQLGIVMLSIAIPVIVLRLPPLLVRDKSDALSIMTGYYVWYRLLIAMIPISFLMYFGLHALEFRSLKKDRLGPPNVALAIFTFPLLLIMTLGPVFSEDVPELVTRSAEGLSQIEQGDLVTITTYLHEHTLVPHRNRSHMPGPVSKGEKPIVKSITFSKPGERGWSSLWIPADYPIEMDRSTMYQEIDEGKKNLADVYGWDKQYQLYTITYAPAFGLIVSIQEAELMPALEAMEFVRY